MSYQESKTSYYGGSPEPGLSSVIKRLEDQHLNGDPGSRSPTVPTKIRDIVTKSISPVEHKMAGSSLGDESRMYQSEISRLEDLLAATRAERDEVGSKYMAVSERVKQCRSCSRGVCSLCQVQGFGFCFLPKLWSFG
ncbi:predicted protein [Nematostella vectensis]|uniref:Uncharacterized protein n=1 Tax=Nematostella vectensis TaxID=45351 RepID=A7S1K8_NEMVE|nr:predicted protein [Nematostella vectensis]|eukprot:XP_001634405.1 predicted protein [Nematostella vectensis]